MMQDIYKESASTPASVPTMILDKAGDSVCEIDLHNPPTQIRDLLMENSDLVVKTIDWIKQHPKFARYLKFLLLEGIVEEDFEFGHEDGDAVEDVIHFCSYLARDLNPAPVAAAEGKDDHTLKSTSQGGMVLDYIMSHDKIKDMLEEDLESENPRYDLELEVKRIKSNDLFQTYFSTRVAENDFADDYEFASDGDPVDDIVDFIKFLQDPQNNNKIVNTLVESLSEHPMEVMEVQNGQAANGNEKDETRSMDDQGTVETGAEGHRRQEAAALEGQHMEEEKPTDEAKTIEEKPENENCDKGDTAQAQEALDGQPMDMEEDAAEKRDEHGEGGKGDRAAAATATAAAAPQESQEKDTHPNEMEVVVEAKLGDAGDGGGTTMPGEVPMAMEEEETATTADEATRMEEEEEEKSQLAAAAAVAAKEKKHSHKDKKEKKEKKDKKQKDKDADQKKKEKGKHDKKKKKQEEDNAKKLKTSKEKEKANTSIKTVVGKGKFAMAESKAKAKAKAKTKADVMAEIKASSKRKVPETVSASSAKTKTTKKSKSEISKSNELWTDDK